MTIDQEAIELATLLSEEGFGTLAGELLIELDRGPPLDADSGSVDDPPKARRDPSRADRDLVQLEEGPEVARAYFDEAGGQEPERRAGPVPEGEQLGHALRFLTLRLVEPLRAVEEAEGFAAEIRASGGKYGDRVMEDPAPFDRRRATLGDISVQAVAPETEERGRRGESRSDTEDRPIARGPVRIAFGSRSEAAGREVAEAATAAELEDVLRRLGQEAT